MDITSAGYMITDLQVSECQVVSSDRDDELCGANSLMVDRPGMDLITCQTATGESYVVAVDAVNDLYELGEFEGELKIHAGESMTNSYLKRFERVAWADYEGYCVKCGISAEVSREIRQRRISMSALGIYGKLEVGYWRRLGFTSRVGQQIPTANAEKISCSCACPYRISGTDGSSYEPWPKFGVRVATALLISSPHYPYTCTVCAYVNDSGWRGTAPPSAYRSRLPPPCI